MKYLVAAAVLPALALLLYIRKLDKVEAEPTGMIMKLCGYLAILQFFHFVHYYSFLWKLIYLFDFCI